jgi:hypothetical protein
MTITLSISDPPNGSSQPLGFAAPRMALVFVCSP